jgi:hypothetical protein
LPHAEEPSLAELRRRAKARLRELSSAVIALERERDEAAAACARLGLPLPGGNGSARPELAASAAERFETDASSRGRDNARLREEVARAVSFLDELIGLLQEPDGSA